MPNIKKWYFWAIPLLGAGIATFVFWPIAVQEVAPQIPKSDRVATAKAVGEKPSIDIYRAPPSAPAVEQISKSRQVEKLSKSPSPVDAFAAYNIVRACVWARRLEREVYENPPNPKPISSSEACGDLAPGQIVSRLQLLDRAASAGVHNAMSAFGMEGPDGNGLTGQEDMNSPAVVELNRRLAVYMEAGVKTGDRFSLMTLSNKYENDEPQDLAKSLTYWVAQNELARAQTGKSDSKSYNNIVTRLSRGLTPDQTAAAINQGKQIALAARPVAGDQK